MYGSNVFCEITFHVIRGFYLVPVYPGRVEGKIVGKRGLGTGQKETGKRNVYPRGQRTKGRKSRAKGEGGLDKERTFNVCIECLLFVYFGC